MKEKVAYFVKQNFRGFKKSVIGLNLNSTDQQDYAKITEHTESTLKISYNHILNLALLVAGELVVVVVLEQIVSWW